MRCIFGSALLAMVAVAAVGEPVSVSKRPLDAARAARAQPSEVLRPQARPSADHNLVPDTVSETGDKPAAFQAWLDQFAQKAARQGISDATLTGALSNVTYDEKVIRRDRNQSEFTKTLWDYLSTAVSDHRIRNGKTAFAQQSATLRSLEAEYGVDPYIVVAIWGLESAFGAVRGSEPTFQSLATLAFDARRSKFFEAHLMAALKIVDQGDATPAQMRGSWAGAMGHTQFMPISFLEHAVDVTGDGIRDIWSDDPRDALGSTAAYLKHHGWTKGQPWGIEVQVPEGFDYTLADRTILRRPSEWAAIGLLDLDGAPVPDHGMASILLPAGSKGAAFMIFDNFEVLERYNSADAYVIGVGHLADRIRGGPAIQGGWPEADRALTFEERIELQERLTQGGFDTQKIDGKIGPLTIAAVRRWQVSTGRVPDGYANLALLGALRGQ